ncbi:MAG: MBL fold metallo-hydrolase [Paracoccaceae bacterium]
MRWLPAFCLALWPVGAGAEARIPSDCIALSLADTAVVPVVFGAPLADDVVRIRYLQHAMFAIEGGGLLAVTDYTGNIGNPDVVPDIVTMNNAHSTHYTDHPDPRIPLVLRGWPMDGVPAAYDIDLGQMRVRNVTTDLRGPFGEGARKDGNSIFIFEVAGLCIGHLSHLHQIPTAAQYAAIGRLDVVMVPVDGAYTMDVADMADVVRHLHARVVLPMHWFSPEGLAQFLVQLKPDYQIVVPGGADVEVSRDALPDRPMVVVLEPALIP